MEVYTIYLKLTNACNLKCKHCYNAVMHNTQTMSDEVLDKSIKFIQQFKTSHQADAIDVQLHGGEPCLYDLDKIIAAVEALQDEQCKFSITTNLVYELTAKHKQLFKLMLPNGNKPYIMTSWDYKIRFSNDDQLKLWEYNVKELTNNEIQVQPIVCVTQQLIQNIKPISIFDYFQTLGVYNMNFERITSTGRAAENDIRPTNRQVDDWLFNAYLEYEKRNFNIPLFSVLKEAVNGNFVGCRARKCMKTVFTINPDGSVATCPNMPLDSIGTVDGLDSNKQHCLCTKEKFVRFQTCSICKFFKVCNGDCCQLEDDESGCPGLKNILKHLIYV